MQLFVLLFILRLTSSEFISKEKASSFLHRVARSNKDSIFEEFSPGNTERECIEEICNYEEAFEVFDQRSMAEAFWNKYNDCKSGKYTPGQRLYDSSAKPQLRLCLTDPDQCSSNPCNEANTRSCSDLLGDFRCNCKTGYQGKRCDTILDHCLSSPCDKTGTNRCVNTDTSFQCQCKVGYRGVRCDVDYNECQSNPCGNHGSCSDLIGDFECLCDNLYTGKLCDTIVDDCRFHGCSTGGRCRATDGVYSCHCNAGYTGELCEIDLDECLSSPCQHNCSNTEGSFQCTCRPGYLLDLSNKASCRDIDECSVIAHGCEHSCVNTAGSFHCLCNKGYKLDSLYNRYCEDINECQENKGGCEERCLNNQGSFTCVCPRGFLTEDDGKTCQDIDECLGYHGCSHSCTNTRGSFSCSCNDGYKLNYDKRSCRDINECFSSPPPCDQKCANTIGSFSCSCNPGYTINQTLGICEDIDECAVNNGDCSELCVNNQGSFSCTCQEGFELIGSKCFDILECASSPCINGRCEDGHLSYQCVCFFGYSGINCELEGNPCEKQPCNNGDCSINGSSFICSCHSGYTGTTCLDDIDECLIDNGNCTNQCVNTIGSHRCECDSGYNYVNNECIDINECEDSTNCDQNCMNIPGSYICGCRNGYIINSIKCEDIDECLETPCGQMCNNLQGSFSCLCWEGFRLNPTGMTCDDVDECEVGDELPCQDRCTNMEGTFRCSCADGYQLSDDGVTCQPLIGCVGNVAVSLKRHLQIGSKTNDYVTLKLIRQLRKKFLIKFRFRTFNKNGVLFATRGHTSHRYAYIAVTEGNLEAGFDFGFGHVPMNPRGQVTISDGQWHSVKLWKRNELTKLFVDKVEISRVTSRGSLKLNLNTSLYFGGLPQNHSLSTKIGSDVQFYGCLSNMTLRGGRVTWMPTKRETTKSHKGCFAQVENRGSYFMGNGYVRIDDYRRSTDFKFTAKFRTGNPNGLLTANMDGRFKLELKDGELSAKLYGVDGDVIAVSVFSSDELCGGLWVSVYCKVSRGNIQLMVNGVRGETSGSVRGHRFDPTKSVYIGGLPNRSVDGFEGSMRLIFINDRRVSLLNSSAHVGVNIMSIPLH